MRAIASKTTIAAFAVLGATALASGTASAMPNGLPRADRASNVEQVRWVCGPYRCWWRPNYYRAYGFYGPRFYGGGWRHGWHRGWHRGWGHRW